MRENTMIYWVTYNGVIKRMSWRYMIPPEVLFAPGYPQKFSNSYHSYRKIFLTTQQPKFGVWAYWAVYWPLLFKKDTKKNRTIQFPNVRFSLPAPSERLVWWRYRLLKYRLADISNCCCDSKKPITFPHVLKWSAVSCWRHNFAFFCPFRL